MNHLYTPALCCDCSTMTRPQWWVGACSNAECRRRLLHPTLLVLDQTPPRSWVCIMGFRLCQQTDAQKVWSNLFHQQFKPARFSFFKWSARSYLEKEGRNFFGATKMHRMMTWYFIRIYVRTTQVSYFEIFICSYAPSEKEHCALHFLRIAFFIDPSLRVPTGIEFALSIKPKR